MEASVETSSEIQSRNLPKLEIPKDARLWPYSVDIDRHGVAEVLRLAGANEEEIPNISIRIQRRDPEEELELAHRTNAYYSRPNKRITLFTDPLWSEQLDIIAKTRAILRTPIKNPSAKQDYRKNLFPELKSGKRFSWYIYRVSPERAISMADKLAHIKAAKQMDGVLHHELKHAADHSQGRLKDSRVRRVLSYAAGTAATPVGFLALEMLTKQEPNPVPIATLTVLSGIIYRSIGEGIYYRFISPTENRARRFRRELKGNPKYRLVTLSPK